MAEDAGAANLFVACSLLEVWPLWHPRHMSNILVWVSCFSLLLQPQFGSPLWRGVGWLSCPPSAWSTGSSLLVGCGLKCSLEDVLGLVSRKLFGSREHSQLLNKRVRIYCIM